MGIGIGEDDMAVITVKKTDLIAALRKNRESHRGVFLEAQEAFRKSCIEELDRRLKDARAGNLVNIAVTFEAPQDHTRDYDRILCMLEMCTKDEIFITEDDFAQYVLDDWRWKRQFLTNAASYTKRNYT